MYYLKVISIYILSYVLLIIAGLISQIIINIIISLILSFFSFITSIFKWNKNNGTIFFKMVMKIVLVTKNILHIFKWPMAFIIPFMIFVYFDSQTPILFVLLFLMFYVLNELFTFTKDSINYNIAEEAVIFQLAGILIVLHFVWDMKWVFGK